MTDKKGDLSDPLQVAVEVTQIKGSLALLTQHVSTGISNMSSQLASVQAEQRDQGKALREVATAQHDMQNHSDGLERLAKAIEHHGTEFSSWRKDHEFENKCVSDRVTSFKGVLVGFGVLASLLSGAVVYIVQQGFTRSDERLAAHIDRSTEEKAAVERRALAMEVEIRELKEMRGLK